MGYVNFISGLLADGRVTVPPYAPLVDNEIGAGDRLIEEFESVYRLSMPLAAPRLVASAARWGAVQFFRGCQFAVYRDCGAELLSQELGAQYSGPVTPDTHYSVDLFFRFLPDLGRFAGSASAHDPLLDYLFRWGRDWPLSSVGMSGIGETSVAGFAENASLLQLYVDRVLAEGDESRLADRRVREGVHNSLGMFADLHPEISRALKKYARQEVNT
jgi:hypothetical protein